jgi:uncharacterized membrane protein
VARLNSAVVVAALLVMLGPASAWAQQTASDAQTLSAASRFGKVLLGGAAGLVLHEGGHLIADWAFEEKVVVRKIDYKGIPFFALSHANNLSPRREFVVSSAGFWAQYLYSEQILTHHPDLRHEQSPFRKGVLTFHVVTSLMYSGAAFGKTGPPERDTRGMAESVKLNERWIGVLVLAPALLDTFRYFHPDARWAAWTSRGVKMGAVALTFK